MCLALYLNRSNNLIVEFKEVLGETLPIAGYIGSKVVKVSELIRQSNGRLHIIQNVMGYNRFILSVDTNCRFQLSSGAFYMLYFEKNVTVELKRFSDREMFSIPKTLDIEEDLQVKHKYLLTLDNFYVSLTFPLSIGHTQRRS
jgi:hypothetical protein